MEIKRDMNSVWLSMVDMLCSDSDEIKVRGMTTYECIGMHCIVDLKKPVLTVASRKLSYRFMLAEAIWILSGSNKLEEIAPYNKRMAEFSDDGIYLFGAYGPRVVGQLGYVAAKLMQDKNTRQAVMTLWRVNPVPSKDIPCTISIQFLIRYNKLCMIQTMRSSDAWLGFPYDIFTFAMIATWLCIWLRQQGMTQLTLGDIIFNAGSSHIYEQHMIKSSMCVSKPETAFTYKPIDLDEFKDPEELIEHLTRLRDCEYEHLKHSFLKELQPVYDIRTPKPQG